MTIWSSRFHWLNSISGINIYRFDVAPPELQVKATETVQEMPVEVNGHKSELHFFTHQKEG